MHTVERDPARCPAHTATTARGPKVVEQNSMAGCVELQQVLDGDLLVYLASLHVVSCLL